MRPYITPTGKYLASLYPLPNYNDPANLYNYVYSALEPTNRHDFKARFDWNISNNTKAYVRVANEGETAESPRGVWWAPGGRRGAADAEHRRATRAVVRRQRRQRAQPVDDERSAGQLQPADARQPLQGSRPAHAGRRRRDFNGIFPAESTSPYLPTDLLHGWGGSGQVGNLWADGATTCTRTTTRCSSATS